MFLHDNARPHSAKNHVRKIFDQCLSLLLYPSYLPKLASSDFHLFHSLQNALTDQKNKNKKCNEKNHVKIFVKKF